MASAIVTGGSSGMGLACVRRLSADGYAVANLDLAAPPDDSPAALTCTLDVSDPEAVAAAVDRAVAELGAPTVVVTAAGIYPRTTLRDLTVEQYRKVMDVNVLGTLLVAQAASRHMTSGTIVTFASIDAYSPHPMQLVYCASKTAILAVTRSLAQELAPAIRVVGVAPGWVETPGMAGSETLAAAVKSIPLGRAAQADDIAALVAVLTSEACAYITGETVVAAGGYYCR